MPYHGGKTFDVDCVAKEGNLVLAIPRLRVYDNPLSPTNQGCIISSNKTIYNYCKKLVNVFKINGAHRDGFIQIDGLRVPIVD